MRLAPFVRRGRGIHPEIDFDALEKFYGDTVGDDVWCVGSPSDMIAWQQLRRGYGIEDAHAIPCDIFTWGKGPSPDPRMTRVGGAPFLPRATPWPKVGDTVMQFLCQFDFRDSRDLDGQTVARALPGDLLLVFVTSESALVSAAAKAMKFVWVSADERDTLPPQDIPKPTDPFAFVEAWGVRHRTVDIPTKWDVASSIPEHAHKGRTSELPVWWATKIGGVPHSSQNRHRRVPRDYLCQLVSIQVTPDRKWPWANVEESVALGFRENDHGSPANSLMIGDLGELTFYLDRKGNVSATSQFG